jgi:hypothetical protein
MGLQTSCILARCRKRISRKRQRRNAIHLQHGAPKVARQTRQCRRDKAIYAGSPSKKSGTAQKGILAPALALRAIAYVCPEPTRKRRPLQKQKAA